MNALIRFQFGNHAIRIQQDTDSQPWFNAQDVCSALDMGNARQALASHVHEDDVQKLDIIDELGRKQKTNFVNESGLYALIFGCTKEAAKTFKKWVTSEVLPSIRKTGTYSRQHAAPSSQVKQLSETTRAFRDVYQLLQALDVDKNTAALRANQAAREVTGLDFLERTGMTPLIAERAAQEAAARQDHPLVEAFWEQVDYLDGKTLKNGDRVELNHSRDETVIALNLVEYEAACSQAGLHLPCELAELKKRLKSSVQRKFVEMKPIWSNLNSRTVRCWLFQTGKAWQTAND